MAQGWGFPDRNLFMSNCSLASSTNVKQLNLYCQPKIVERIVFVVSWSFLVILIKCCTHYNVRKIKKLSQAQSIYFPMGHLVQSWHLGPFTRMQSFRSTSFCFKKWKAQGLRSHGNISNNIVPLQKSGTIRKVMRKVER